MCEYITQIQKNELKTQFVNFENYFQRLKIELAQ